MTQNNNINKGKPSQLTSGGYAIVERIVMTKRKPSQQLDHRLKRHHDYKDSIYYLQTRTHQKITKVSPTKISKRPIYEFFIDHDNRRYLLRCMLDLVSTSFVLSPNVAKAFRILVIRRKKKVQP